MPTILIFFTMPLCVSATIVQPSENEEIIVTSNEVMQGMKYFDAAKSVGEWRAVANAVVRIKLEKEKQLRNENKQLRNETKQLLEENINLKNNLNLVCIPLQATQIKSATEEKVNKLHPNGKPPYKGYMDCLQDIVTSNEPQFTSDIEIMTFRETIKEVMPIDHFMNGARGLYLELSEKANHKMRGFCPNLPNYQETDKIERILNCVDITAYSHYIQTIQVILKPYSLLPEDRFTKT